MLYGLTPPPSSQKSDDSTLLLYSMVQNRSGFRQFVFASFLISQTTPSVSQCQNQFSKNLFSLCGSLEFLWCLFCVILSVSSAFYFLCSQNFITRQFFFFHDLIYCYILSHPHTVYNSLKKK